jgi:hypothetical protein
MKAWIPLIGLVFVKELPNIKFWNVQTITYLVYQITMEIILLYSLTYFIQ